MGSNLSAIKFKAAISKPFPMQFFFGYNVDFCTSVYPRWDIQLHSIRKRWPGYGWVKIFFFMLRKVRTKNVKSREIGSQRWLKLFSPDFSAQGSYFFFQVRPAPSVISTSILHPLDPLHRPLLLLGSDLPRFVSGCYTCTWLIISNFD